eukprot:5796663-Amphidinium_carterae.1
MHDTSSRNKRVGHHHQAHNWIIISGPNRNKAHELNQLAEEHLGRLGTPPLARPAIHTKVCKIVNVARGSSILVEDVVLVDCKTQCLAQPSPKSASHLKSGYHQPQLRFIPLSIKFMNHVGDDVSDSQPASIVFYTVEMKTITNTFPSSQN